MEWHNWSGSVSAQPHAIARPRNESELRAAILSTPRVRVRGAGHSFMPLCETDGTLIDMSDYAAPIEIAADRASAWVPAGWSLARLTEALWKEGVSLINQGDVNPQSLAGATATGTHGTGKDLGSLSTQVTAFELMLADGALVVCDAGHHPDLFQAQRLSLGLFGVATRIRINVLPAYYLEERVEARPLGEMAERWQELAAATRHFEFFVFPYADTVIFKSLHPIAGEGEMPLDRYRRAPVPHRLRTEPHGQFPDPAAATADDAAEQQALAPRRPGVADLPRRSHDPLRGNGI